MIRKEPERGGGGRRPLLAAFVGNNRQMLNDIRDSLSHLRKCQLEGDGDGGIQHGKSELSQSTPNLADKAATPGTKKGLETHTKALAEIRETLRPYQNATGGRDRPQGSNEEVTRSHIQFIMTKFGVDEDFAVRALSICNSNLDSTPQTLVKVFEKNNGSRNFSAGLPSYPINRRPSFESKYGPSSPAASETNSVRSDSPSLTTVPLIVRQPLVNGHQTPPPLPPRVPISTHSSPQTPNNPQAHARGHTPPPLPQGEGSAASINGPGSQASSTDIPAGHVQQMIKLMSPGQFRNQVIQNQVQPAGQGSLGLAQQRGQAGISARQVLGGGGGGYSPGQGAPNVIGALTQSLQHSLVLTQQGLASSASSNSSSASSTPALSGPHHTINLSHPPPPPYTQATPGHGTPYTQAPPSHTAPYSHALPYTQALATPSLLHKAVEQSHMLGAQLDYLVAAQDSPLNLSTTSSSLLSDNSSGGGVVPGVGVMGPGRGPVVADRRLMAPHAPVIMQSVKSKEVHKPVPQTATAPKSPPPPVGQGPSPPVGGTSHSYISQVQAQVNMSGAGGSGSVPGAAASVTMAPTTTTTTTHTRNLQIHITGHAPHHVVHSHPHNAGPQYATEPLLTHGSLRPTIQINIPSGAALTQAPAYPNHLHLNYEQLYGRAHSDTISTPRSDSPVSHTTSQSPLSMMSTTSSPSTNSDIPDKPPPPYPYSLHSAMRQPPLPPRVPLQNKPPPPPPPPSLQGMLLNVPLQTAMSQPCQRVLGEASQLSAQPGLHTSLPGVSHNGQAASSIETASEQGEDTDTETVSSSDTGATGGGAGGEKHRCMSPMPQRKPEARERDRLRRDTKVRIYSPQAFKFYMEQHVENVLKIHQQRLRRRTQLENEMAKVNLSEEAAHQMRRMLHQKESNYIRLKRAKMDKSMFEKIKTLGVGAFGEVALCRKKDTGMLYAMKTLRKSDVLKRNQVAHVKAERDILAEADNEWVVKLYYSFQDHNYLYFVMDYVPGGDLMGLLIRTEILDEPLARFYVAELVQAIESVHRMGFIHRDIKPDNILIDRNGHIKLTDFGLCTGFRWTHNSKYYQGEGTHARQDSMEVKCQLDEQCQCEILKPLERRRKREQRCLAHSLVGTPNYIAPEVLLRSAGYTSVCDWWSVGVILYEMLVGRPPFYANTPAETQYKVINWKDTLKIPRESNLSQAAKDLIVRLCCGPDDRLGLKGAGQIKDHLFFSGVNFDTLRKQRPPYIPNIRHATDTSNFDPVDPDRLRNSDSEENRKVEKLENGKHPEHAFFEFTFRRFFDDGGHPMATTLEDPDSNSPVYV